MGRATVKDVARYAEVSQGVVSRVVNPGTGPVSPATREKVLAAIDALDYRPHRGARDLRTATTTTIGLVLADVSNEFYSLLADHLVSLARERGLGVLVTTTQEDAEAERACLELLMEQRVAGIIGAPVGDDATAWEQARAFGVELVFIDRALDHVSGADVVGIDNPRAAHVATAHLLGMGHRRVALIGGPLSTSTGRERIAGYTEALARANIEPDPTLVHAVPFRGGAGVAAVDTLLGLPAPPTALVLGNTAAAWGVVARLRERGVQVPANMSLVVFHDLAWTSLLDPPITVVRHDVRALAETALSRLLLRLGKGDVREGRQFHMVSELVVRGSDQPPANGGHPLP